MPTSMHANRKTCGERWCCCILRLRPRRRRQLLYRLLLVLLIASVISTGIMLFKINFYHDISEEFFRDILDTLRLDMLFLSPTCAIPWMEPHNPQRTCTKSGSSIARFNQRLAQPVCHQWSQPFVEANDTSVFLTRPTGSVECCYVLPKSNKCRPIPHGGVNVLNNGTEAEYVRVNCDLFYLYKSYHMFPFIRDIPKVEIRLEEMKKKVNKKHPPFNVLVLGLGGVSRAAFHRQLPVTTSILQEMGMVEMGGYASLGVDPAVHASALLTGLTREELESKGCKADGKANSCPLVWKKFSEKGFRTMRASDCPTLDLFYDAPVDYSYRPIAEAIEKNMAHQKGNPSSCYICAGEKTQLEVMLSYVEKFARHFQNESYWAMAWSQTLSQDNMAGSARADLYFSTFLSKAEREGFLKNTVLIVVSDRGTKETDFVETYRGQLEMRLPMMLIILPQNFKNEHPMVVEVLRANSGHLTTPFDVHATLMDLADVPFADNASSTVDKTGFGRSLLRHLPENRTCTDVGVSDEWCSCIRKTDYSVTSDLALDAAEYLEEYVGRLLAPHTSICRPWKVHKVLLFELLDQPHGVYIGRDLYPHVTYILKVIAAEDSTVYRVPMLLWFPEKWAARNWQDRWYVHEAGIEPLNATSHTRNCISDQLLHGLCYCNSTGISSKHEKSSSTH